MIYISPRSYLLVFQFASGQNGPEEVKCKGYLALWPWAGNLITLSPTFFIWKIVTVWGPPHSVTKIKYRPAGSKVHELWELLLFHSLRRQAASLLGDLVTSYSPIRFRQWWSVCWFSNQGGEIHIDWVSLDARHWAQSFAYILSLNSHNPEGKYFNLCFADEAQKG